MSHHVFVRDFGSIWRMTPKQWANWLHAQARGLSPSLQDFGAKEIVSRAYCIDDMSHRDAKRLLNETCHEGQPEYGGRTLLTKDQRMTLDLVDYDDDGWVLREGGVVESLCDELDAGGLS